MSDYNKLPVAEKQAHALARARDAAVTCPNCDTHVMPADLIPHLDKRCPGRLEPGPAAQWVNWKGALALGVPARTFKRWVRRGHVRFVGGRGDRMYLLRDLTVRIAQQRASRRR